MRVLLIILLASSAVLLVAFGILSSFMTTGAAMVVTGWLAALIAVELLGVLIYAILFYFIGRRDKNGKDSTMKKGMMFFMMRHR